MALLTSEIYRCKAELGYNVLTINSEPRIDHVAIFDQVIQPYTQAGATTTSSTAVTAGSEPAPAVVLLASATGFTVGDTIVVDVDARQERATIQSLSGFAATVLLSNSHSGTYPVTVEGGEAIVRDILRKLYALTGPGGQIEAFASSAGLKRAEDIEWYANGSGGSSKFDDLKRLRMYYRDELSSALGVPNMWRMRGGSSRSALY